MKNLKELIQEKLKVSKNTYIPPIEEFIKAFAQEKFMRTPETIGEYYLGVNQLDGKTGKTIKALLNSGELPEIYNINKDTTNIVLPIKGKIYLSSINLIIAYNGVYEIWLHFFREEHGLQISRVKLNDNKYLIDILGEELYLDFFEILNT